MLLFLCISCFLDGVLRSGVRWNLSAPRLCILLMTKEVGHFPTYFLAIYISFFHGYLFSSPPYHSRLNALILGTRG